MGNINRISGENGGSGITIGLIIPAAAARLNESKRDSAVLCALVMKANAGCFQSNRIALIGVILEIAIVGRRRMTVTSPRVMRLSARTISQCQLIGTKLI